MALNMNSVVQKMVKPAAKVKQFGGDLDSHLGVAPAKAEILVESKVAKGEYKQQSQESETLVPGLFHTNGMKITVEGGTTINLGNYESAKIGVSVTIPCSPDTMNEAYDYGLAWVGERISKETKNAKGH
jgi:uncharacterized protein GlcG (DUF336 family)